MNQFPLNKGVLAVDLIKVARMQQEEQMKSGDYQEFYSLGYYDSVRIYTINHTSDFTKILSTTGADTERIVFIPSSEIKQKSDEEYYQNEAFGVMTFLIVKEDRERELIEIGRILKDYLHNYGFNTCSYLTTGASAIASLTFVKSSNQTGAEIKNYFVQLKKFIEQEQRCVYSFSTILLNPDSDDLGTGEFPGVYVTVSKNLRGKGFEEACNKIKNYLSGGNLLSGMITGTDDYFIGGKSIPEKLFHQLFRDLRKVGVGGESPFDSTFTTLLFEEDQCMLQNIDQSSLTPFFNKWKTTINRANDATDHEIEEIIKKVTKTPSMMEQRTYLEEFVSLRQSEYTRWAYQQYKEIVALFSTLMIKGYECKNTSDSRKIENKADRVHFFQTLSSMLEALLNTSAFFTDSPGYRRVENNAIPRLILIYQTLLNNLVGHWECYTLEYERNRKASTYLDRRHLFFLSVRNNLSMEATKYHQALPPDQRVISISIPLYQAFQPATLLPKLLHEAGHYIGARNRNQDDDNSRKHLFIELSVKKMFDEWGSILQKKCKKQKCKDTENYKKWLFFFQTHIYPEVTNCIDRVYKIIKDAKLAEMRNNNEENVVRERFATEQDYFEEMRSIVSGAFLYLLKYNKEEIIDQFNDFFEDIRTVNEVSRRDSLQFYDEIAELISQTYDLLTERFESNEARFIQQSEEVLGEVAADVFMVSLCGITSQEYALLLFEDNLYNHPKKEITNRIYASTNMYARIVAVISAMTGELQTEVSSLEVHRIASAIEYTNGIGGELTVEEAIMEYRRYKELIISDLEELVVFCNMDMRNDENEWKYELVEHLNPIPLLRRYAHQLLCDPRYKREWDHTLFSLDVYNKMKKQRDNLQKLYTHARNEQDGTIDIDTALRSFYDMA